MGGAAEEPIKKNVYYTLASEVNPEINLWFGFFFFLNRE